MTNKNHKLAAIVFTDIVGYTKSMEKNEQLTLELLEKQREILFPLVDAHDGEVVKEIGDGLMIMFHSAVEAVRFAINVQKRLKDEELTIRTGIHIGDVIFKDGDVFGSAVNTAARIEPLAPPNGICISKDVRSQIRNKEDIHTVSIGKKELKGVNEPIEIYKVLTDDISAEDIIQPVSLLKDLWDRRVFQIVAIYLAGSWLVKLAISAIVTRYLLSPHIIGLIWVILLSLLPTVILLAYFHGKKKAGSWTKVELVGMPINAVLTILLIVFLFKGKDLGATTQAITVENEDGEKIERVVLKNEFRKKTAIFFFENETKDSTLNWLQYAISSMLNYDLSQDINIDARTGFNFFHKLKEFGFPKGVGLPFTLEKKIADYYHLNYFLTGSFTKQLDEYSIKALLYETKNGKLIAENIFTGTDIFNLIDELTIQLKKDMDIPESYLEEVNDLPLSEIFTTSFPALVNFTKGQNLIIIDNNWSEGAEYFEKAIKEDPGFTLAYLSLAEVYFNTNQMEKVKTSLQDVRQNLYKLPESLQFNFKYFYYIINSEPEKAFAVVKMWVELFPDDIKAHYVLAARYVMKNQLQEAIAEFNTILQLDPEQYDYLINIGNLYVKMAEYDKALDYYKQYEKQFPKDYKSYRNIGYLFYKKGDYEQARSYYEKALLIETDQVSLLLKLIDIDMQLGNFTEALDQNLKALKKCKTSSDSTKVYSSLESYYELAGQINESIKYMELKHQEMEKSGTPLNNLAQKVFDINKYSEAGNSDKAFRILKEMESQFTPPLDNLVYFGYLLLYLDLEDVDNAEKAIVNAEKLIHSIGQGNLQPSILYGLGRIHEIKGEYDKAINSYLQGLELQPTNININRFIGRCYRKLNKFKKAEEYLLLASKDSPFSPNNNYELALLYLDMEDTQKALDHLRIANDIWKDADTSYKPAQKAKKKLVEIDI